MSGKEKGLVASLKERARSAAQAATKAVSGFVDGIETSKSPSSPAVPPRGGGALPPRGGGALPPSAADIAINKNVSVSAFCEVLATVAEAQRLKTAREYIDFKQAEIGFADVKIISGLLQKDGGTQYTNEDAFKLGASAIGEPQRARFTQNYLTTVGAGEKTEQIFSFLSDKEIPEGSKPVIAEYLYENRLDETLGYFREKSSKTAGGDFSAYYPPLARAISSLESETLATSTSADEVRLFSRALNYEMPEDASEYLSTLKTAKAFKEGLVSIARERLAAGKITTYSDIQAMAGMHVRHIRIDAIARGSVPQTIEANDVVSSVVKKLEGEDQRAGEAAESSSKKFIQGLGLRASDALALAKDESMPAAYISDLLDHDGANTQENIIEIGKARKDLNFDEIKDLLKAPQTWGRSNAKLFEELAADRAAKDEHGNPESGAQKFVETLPLQQVTGYVKDAPISLGDAGLLLRATKRGNTPENLEYAYLDLVSLAHIGGNLPTVQEKFAAYKGCAAAIGVSEEKQFDIAASATLRNISDVNDIKQILEKVPESNSAGTKHEDLTRKARILFDGNVSLDKVCEVDKLANNRRYDLLNNLAMIYVDKGQSQEFTEKFSALELPYSDKKKILFGMPDSGLRKAKWQIAAKLLEDKDAKQNFADYLDLKSLVEQKKFDNGVCLSFASQFMEGKEKLSREELNGMSATFANRAGIVQKEARIELLTLADSKGIAVERGFIEKLSFGWQKLRYGKAGYQEKCKQKLATFGLQMSEAIPDALAATEPAAGPIAQPVLEHQETPRFSASEHELGTSEAAVANNSEPSSPAISRPAEYNAEIKILEELKALERSNRKIEGQFRDADETGENITISFVSEDKKEQINNLLSKPELQDAEKARICKAFSVENTEENLQLVKELAVEITYPLSGYLKPYIEKYRKARADYVELKTRSSEVAEARRVITGATSSPREPAATMQARAGAASMAASGVVGPIAPVRSSSQNSRVKE